MSKSIFIVSSGIGKAGGADRVAFLLAKEYSTLGFKVRVFATACEIKGSDNFQISGPFLINGYRFRLPQISLLLKILYFSLIKKPLFIHSIGMTLEIRLLLKYLHRLKIIIWETTESKPYNKFIDPLIHKYLSNASLVLTPSQTIKENFISTFNYKREIEILPFWVEWHQKPIIASHRTRKLLYFGRMDKDKGIECLISAFKSLPKNLNLELNICGRGKADYIDNLIDNHSSIHIHGWVNDTILEGYIDQSDYIILPSLHEGYPLSLIEACGFGKPIIATKVGSIPEVFEKSEAGHLFNPGNTQELASIIHNCYNESDENYILRCQCARALFEKVNSLNNIDLQLIRITTLMEHNDGE